MNQEEVGGILGLIKKGKKKVGNKIESTIEGFMEKYAEKVAEFIGKNLEKYEMQAKPQSLNLEKVYRSLENITSKLDELTQNVSYLKAEMERIKKGG